MATKSLNIVGGPSKWDLMLAVFDRDHEPGREVMLLIEDWTGENRTVNVHVIIPSIKQEQGSCEAWKFEGTVVDGPDEVLKHRVKGCYDTKARKGKLELLGDGNPPEKELIDCHGIIIHKEWGSIVAAENNSGVGDKVRVGDMVASNGRFSIPEGTRGLVVDIYEPFTRGSTDIIQVWFEGRRGATSMKFKDLKF